MSAETSTDPTPPADTTQTPPPETTTQTPPTPEFTPLTAESLVFAEGTPVNEAARDEFLGILNNQELDQQGRANALIELNTKYQTEAATAATKAWTDMQENWQNEVRSDTEIGGAKLDSEVLPRIGQLVDRYGTQELRDVFATTGAGNNIHMVKFLNKIALDLTEGGPVQGTTPATPQSVANRLFPSMAK